MAAPKGTVVPNAGGNEAAKGATATSGAFTKALGASTKLAGGIKSLGSGARSLASGALPSASSAAHALGQGLGGMATDGADKLAGALGQLGPAGAAAGAAVQAMGAIVSATIGTLADLAGMAIEVSQKIDLMRDRFAALAGSAAGGKAVQGSIAKLAATLPFASSQVSAWAQSLLAAGLQGKQLEESIKGIAAAQALMGDAGGAAAEKMLKQLAEGGAAADKMVKALQTGGPKSARLLAEMGLHTSDLAAALGVSEAQFGKMKLNADQMNQAITKALQKKGKGPLEDMALTLPSILQKAREGFMSLFSGVGGPVKAFMQAVKSLFAEFNKGGGVAKGLKPVFTAVLTTVFKYATMAVKAVHNLIGGFMGSKKATGPFAAIGAAIRKVWNSVSGLFAALGKLNKGSPSGLTTALNVLVVVIQMVATVISTMIDNATMALDILGSLGSIVDTATSALSGLADGAMSAAGSFIDGIVNGITSGAGAVYDAVASLASGALSKFKSMLGIASPSRVMMKMGGHVAAGASEGIDRGAGQVQDSAAALGAGVKGGAAKGMAGAGGKGKGGSITINGGVHIEVPHGTPSAWAEEAFAAFMERLAASQGA